MRFLRCILVALLILGGASLFVPSVHRSRTNLDEIRCRGNLSNLQGFGVIYAEKGDGYFPLSANGSIAAFQHLVETFPDFFSARPDVFICPDGQETPPSFVDGQLTLTTETCSYEAVPWTLKYDEQNAILYYDKKPHHRNGRIVVLTDGTILFMLEDRFQKRMEVERARFAVSTIGVTPDNPK